MDTYKKAADFQSYTDFFQKQDDDPNDRKNFGTRRNQVASTSMIKC